MLNVRYFIGIVLLGLLAALSGCKKDGTNTPPTPPTLITRSKADLLTAHPWYLTAQVHKYPDGGKVITVDQLMGIPNCAKDNSIYFQPDHRFAFNPNALLCDFRDVPKDGIWSFANDETHVLLPNLGLFSSGIFVPFGELQLLKVTESTLSLRWAGTNFPGNVEETVYTYSATNNVALSAVELNMLNSLTAHKWRLSKHIIRSYGGGSSVDTDKYAQLSACQRDDFVQFNSNYTLVVDEGASRCSPTDPQTRSTDWLLTDYGRAFRLKNDIMPGYYTSYFLLMGMQVTDTKLTMTWDNHSMNSGYGASAYAEYTAF